MMIPARAGVAQLAEQLIRNQQVLGSSPSAGSSFDLGTSSPDPLRARSRGPLGPRSARAARFALLARFLLRRGSLRVARSLLAPARLASRCSLASLLRRASLRVARSWIARAVTP